MVILSPKIIKVQIWVRVLVEHFLVLNQNMPSPYLFKKEIQMDQNKLDQKRTASTSLVACHPLFKMMKNQLGQQSLTQEKRFLLELSKMKCHSSRLHKLSQKSTWMKKSKVRFSNKVKVKMIRAPFRLLLRRILNRRTWICFDSGQTICNLRF